MGQARARGGDGPAGVGLVTGGTRLPLGPPALVFKGEHWPGDRVTATAAAWRETLVRACRGATGPLALVMANQPQSVALFFALSSLPAPLVLLPPDLAPWPSSPPLPPDTRLVLTPAQRGLRREVDPLGLSVTMLDDVERPAIPAEPPAFLTTPGIVLFTSGSTGPPRPVYRSASAILDVSRALIAAVGLASGTGVIATLPLARAFGLNHAIEMAAGQEQGHVTGPQRQRRRRQRNPRRQRQVRPQG